MPPVRNCNGNSHEDEREDDKFILEEVSKLLTGCVYIAKTKQHTKVCLVPVGRRESYVLVSAAAVTLFSQKRSLSAPAASFRAATVNTSAAATASAAWHCEK